jgi:hypothetical protein
MGEINSILPPFSPFVRFLKKTLESQCHLHEFCNINDLDIRIQGFDTVF